MKKQMQQTIKEPVTCTGIGLHHGVDVRVTLAPAPVDTGVVFIRKFKNRSVYIDAHLNNVFDTMLSTSLGVRSIHIHTIEHLMAACRGMGVDNVYIILNAHEAPIMDGSASCFTDAINAVGIEKQGAPRQYIKIVSAMEVSNKNQTISISPADEEGAGGGTINYTVDFTHPMANKQSHCFMPEIDSFADEIASARTFCRYEDIESIKKMGMAKGGSLDNAIVIGNDSILNEEGLRYDNEFARHKMLDLIGDLSLIGYPVAGNIKAVGSGHFLNVRFAKELMTSRHCWELVTSDALVAARLTACV